MSRQQERAELRRKHFRRMEWNASHQVRNPHTNAVIGTLPMRADRRKLARAYAAGEWKNRKAVA